MIAVASIYHLLNWTDMHLYSVFICLVRIRRNHFFISALSHYVSKLSSWNLNFCLHKMSSPVTTRISQILLCNRAPHTRWHRAMNSYFQLTSLWVSQPRLWVGSSSATCVSHSSCSHGKRPGKTAPCTRTSSLFTSHLPTSRWPKQVRRPGLKSRMKELYFVNYEVMARV